MTAPPTIQTNPLDPVFSGVPVVISQGNLVTPTWNKWFVDLREKVNVINSTLAAWSGITPVTGLTPGTYGDATHYPKVTVNEFGLITAVAIQSISGGGGGNPMNVTTVSSNHTVVLADVPNASSNIGIIVQNSSSANLIQIDTFANSSIPVGTDLTVFQQGIGTTTISGLPGVTFIGPTITGGGQNSMGRAIQISTDTWLITGNLAYSAGGDPYWANVVSLLHFDGTNGSTTITDQIASNTWTCGGSTALSTSQVKFGTASASWPTHSTSNKISGPTGLSAFSGNFTIEMWVYLISLDSSGYINLIFGNDRTSGPRGVEINWTTSNYITCGVPGGSNVTSSNTVPLNTWFYIGVSVSGTAITMNINGTITTGTWTVGQGNVTNPLTFGTHTDGVTSYNGYIDEFRLTKGIARDVTLVPSAAFPNS